MDDRLEKLVQVLQEQAGATCEERLGEVHVFVDATARSGQQTALTLRVEPLVEAAMPRSVTLSAQVSQP
jgi:hypothetical protein